MQPDQIYAYRTLLRAGARSDRSTSIDDLSLASWCNDSGYATYERANHHTLSLYLKGGGGTRRMVGEKSFGSGHPGAICVMPAEVKSEWQIESPLAFLHLYFDQQTFDQTVIETYDTNPGNIEIRDIAFHSDQFIERICRQKIIPLDWDNPADRLQLSGACERLLLHVFEFYTNRRLQAKKYRGGLSPVILKRVKDHIEDSLALSITLRSLANIAKLSPFHFSRMFAESEGVSPHQYLLFRRILRAKNLLSKKHMPLAKVAHECGFSSQSHLSKRFRLMTGVTPNSFRQNC